MSTIAIFSSRGTSTYCLIQKARKTFLKNLFEYEIS